MGALDPTKDYTDLAEKAFDELGVGVYSKHTILSAIGKPTSQYWWARLRRGCAQVGILLKEKAPRSGEWELLPSTGDSGGIIEERQDLHEEWNKNLDGDIKALMDSIATDSEELMVRIVDRGYDPYKILYLAAANGAAEHDIERMALTLGAPDVRGAIPSDATKRHNRIMGLLEQPSKTKETEH